MSKNQTSNVNSTMEAPRWQTDLDVYRRVKTTFVLDGNINDLQLAHDLDDQESYYLNRLGEHLYYLLKDYGYESIVFYNLVSGFHNPVNNNRDIPEFLNKFGQTGQAGQTGQVGQPSRQGQSVWAGQSGQMHQPSQASQMGQEGLGDAENNGLNNAEAQDISFRRASEIIARAMASHEKPVAIIFNLATPAIMAANNLNDSEREAFSRLFLAGQKTCVHKIGSGLLHNLLFIIVEKANDLPPWLFLNNPQARTLHLAKPDAPERRGWIQQNALNAFRGFAMQDLHAQEQLVSDLVNLTDGMYMLELDGFLQVCANGMVAANDARTEIQTFRYGRAEDYWARLGRDTLDRAREMLSERIKGQDHALTKAIQVLARAAAGLSGGAGAADSKPRGILFLAGPTGTGKTELAKTLTQIVFSDERRMIRFDMSEFAAAHADQRLFGAPPGYVGYESGGELTNAVREHPFSILLFDEIEKAHPDILDKFLQILEDGRLTDSHGDTVYFGGTFIIFTSNLGMSSRDEKTGEILADIRPGQLSYEQLRQQVWQGIRANMRPELLNRIGENYIVFDFISEQTAREILQVKLIAVQKKMQEDRGISLRFGSELVARLEELACANIANGGRGVVNIVEEYVLNPLAMTLFACDIGAGERLELIGHYAGTDKKLAGTFEYRRV